MKGTRYLINSESHLYIEPDIEELKTKNDWKWSIDMATTCTHFRKLPSSICANVDVASGWGWQGALMSMCAGRATHLWWRSWSRNWWRSQGWWCCRWQAGGLLNGVVEGLRRADWADVPIVAMETVGAHSLNAVVKAVSWSLYLKLPGKK